MTFTLFFT